MEDTLLGTNEKVLDGRMYHILKKYKEVQEREVSSLSDEILQEFNQAINIACSKHELQDSERQEYFKRSVQKIVSQYWRDQQKSFDSLETELTDFSESFTSNANTPGSSLSRAPLYKSIEDIFGKHKKEQSANMECLEFKLNDLCSDLTIKKDDDIMVEEMSSSCEEDNEALESSPEATFLPPLPEPSDSQVSNLVVSKDLDNAANLYNMLKSKKDFTKCQKKFSISKHDNQIRKKKKANKFQNNAFNFVQQRKMINQPRKMH